MKHIPKKFFLSGLIIGGLIFIIGTFFLIEMKRPPIFDKSKFPEGDVGVINGEEIRIPSKNNTATKNKKKTISPDASGTYFEGTTIPKLSDRDKWVAMMKWHSGPQTVEALMESYHVAYMQSKICREINKKIPPEQWLQYVLDNGYNILTYLEYVQFMDTRNATNILENPSERKSYAELYELPETDIERLEEGVIL